MISTTSLITDQVLRDLVASLAVQQADTIRGLDKAFVLLGSVGQNHGSVVEKFFLNSLEAKPVQSWVRYDEVNESVEDFSGKLRGEYDAVMANGKWQKRRVD